MPAVGYTSGDDRKLNADGGTVYSLTPPVRSGLSPLVADGATNDSATLQSHLDYMSGRGGGQVVLPPGKVIKCNAGISIPDKVQLISDESTLLDFSGIGTGTAITVSGQDYTPMVGVRLEGPNTTASLSDTSRGIAVTNTGIGLRFYNTRVKYFGRGIDLASDNNFILSFFGGDVGNCGTCVYADMEAVGASNAGERLVFENFTFYNSALGLNVTGNGTSFYLTHCSIDFCTEFGRFLNPFIYFTACHLERDGDGVTSYLFNVSGNSHMQMANVNIIMGQGSGGLYYLFDPDLGPSNFAFGRALFSNVNVFYHNPAGFDSTVFSDQLYSWETDTTTTTLHTPFPLRWCAVDARFAITDTYSQPNTDQVQISATDGSGGHITLTTPAYAGQRWIRVRY